MSNINTNRKNVKTTNGITIEVEVQFQTKYSMPYSDQNVFTYEIRIYNGNSFGVQLLRRYWKIWESNGTLREVKGEGVIGVQPVLPPNESHRYESFCPIISPIGKMSGTYQMIRLDNNEKFEVEIPEFILNTPQMLN